MKRYNVLLLIFIAMAMQLPIFAADAVNKGDVADTKPYTKGQKEMSFEAVEVPLEIKAKLKDKILSLDAGNEYYVIMPPNDVDMATGEMGIYICSGKNKITRVVIERKGHGVIWAGSIIGEFEPMTVCSTGAARNPFTYGGIGESEILQRNAYPTSYSESNVGKEQAYYIYTEPDPETGIIPEIFVYIGSFRSATADGYMALPVTGLGSRYVHCSSADNDEGSRKSEAAAAFRTGFSCIAVADNTVIDYKLVSKIEYCITFDGKKATRSTGITYQSPMLQKGDVWSVCNGINSIKNQVCDFTGTIVYSNKNFAMISWTQRTAFPVGFYTNRDNLCEQLLPTDKWGKKHITAQLLGKFSTSSFWNNTGSWLDQNPGQYYRVCAREDNTYSKATWYDLISYAPINSWEIYLAYEGDWGEYLPIIPVVPGTQPQHSICGVCYWEATKPVQIMMYMHSAATGTTTGEGFWYRSGIQDPFMVVIPPVEQYGYQTTFVTAVETTNSGFEEHFVNLYIEGPTKVLQDSTIVLDTAKRDEYLNSLKFYEGKISSPVSSMDPLLFVQNIPNTPYYFARVKLKQNETYFVEGRVRASAVVYGMGSVISYSWPASMKLINTNTFDFLPPEINNAIPMCSYPTRPGEIGYVSFTTCWADTVVEEPSEWVDTQEDIGLIKPPSMVFDATNNVKHQMYFYNKPQYTPSPVWRTGTYFLEGCVEYRTIDPYEDVFAVIMLEDAAGNEAFDTLIYVADKLEFFDAKGNVKHAIDFGDMVTVLEPVYDTIIIKNINTQSVNININEIFLVNGGHYSGSDKIAYTIIEGADIEVLAAGQEHTIIIEYIPQSEAQVTDKLMIYTQCLYFDLEIFGGAGFAQIHVSDWDFGQVMVGTSSPNRQITITNNGSNELVITDYYFEVTQDPVTGPFFYRPNPVSSVPTVTNPWRIVAGASRTINYVTYTPQAMQADEVKLFFVSNANPNLYSSHKDYSLLTGQGISTGPMITSYDWQRRRVNTTNDCVIELTNVGNTPITIREIINTSWIIDPFNNTMTSSDGSYILPNYNTYAGRVVQPLADLNFSEDERIIKIPVHFNPKSEYPHLQNGVEVGSCAKSEHFFVNFDNASGVPNNTCSAMLYGEAFLPKINAEGYEWKTPTMLDETSEEIGEVLITNTSYTSVLTIKEINLLQTDQWQDFNLGNLDRYKDSIILIADDNNIKNHLVIPAYFTPSSTSPDVRRAYVQIITDAKHGEGKPGAPDPFPSDTVVVLLVATAIDAGLDVKGYNFGDIARCDSPIGTLTIINMSTTTTMEVNEIRVEADYKDVLIQKNNLGTINIAPNSTGTANKVIDFQFMACELPEGPVKINVEVFTNMGSATALFEVNPIRIPVKVVVSDIADTKPNENIRIPISIELANDNNIFYTFDNAKITSFTLKLLPANGRYSLYFETGKNIPYNSGTTNIRYDLEQNKDNGLVTITAESVDGTPIKPGIILAPTVKLLLSDLKDISLEVVNLDVNDRTCCVYLDAIKNGNVRSTICNQDIRGGALIAGSKYSLEPISPNPYTSNTLEFNYGIGLDGNATIDIYNSNGELVKSVFNGFAKSGEYTANENITNLSSGAYTIVLKAGPVEEKQKFIIVK